MSLTIAYTTSRKEPRFDWFFSSLSKQIAKDDSDLSRLKIIVVDFFKKDRDFTTTMGHAYGSIAFKLLSENTTWREPKPTVWQGPHRLTSVDYFAAANSRNTALCLASSDWIAYVDDLSVLMPGWLAAAEEAMKREHTITLGAYRKVFDLEVESGLVKSFRSDPNGLDVRLKKSGNVRRHCSGRWFYGSSLVAPVEAFLQINGWDENCDGMGYEDVVTGEILQNAGWSFFYEPAMLTYESQELHHQEPRMLRLDKGVSPNDKSHAALASAKSRKASLNHFGEEGIRGLRQSVLAGEPFSNLGLPDRDWFDSQRLSEM